MIEAAPANNALERMAQGVRSAVRAAVSGRDAPVLLESPPGEGPQVAGLDADAEREAGGAPPAGERGERQAGREQREGE